MELFPADYVILVIAAVAAVFGLFGGFSGALAFFLGAVVAAVSGYFAWGQSLGWFDAAWARALATGAISLVAFGLMRTIVRKVVHGILAQPADALCGVVVYAACAFAMALSALYLASLSGVYAARSALLERVSSCVVGVDSGDGE